MKRTHYLFIVLIFLNIGHIIAQDLEEIRPFRIGTAFGCSFAGYRDETNSPINKYLNAPTFIVDGNIEKGDFLYSINFGLFGGKNKPKELETDEEFYVYYERESTFFRMYLENALDYRLWGADDFPGYLGGALRADIYFVYMPQTIYYNITGVVSLNIHATQKWIINKDNNIVFSASLPILGYIVRPPYYGLYYSPLDLDRKVVSLHNYQAIFGNVKYHYEMSDLLSLYAGLGLELSHIKFPQPRRDASMRLSTGIVFTF